jgi:hypothetical protein
MVTLKRNLRTKTFQFIQMNRMMIGRIIVIEKIGRNKLKEY